MAGRAGTLLCLIARRPARVCLMALLAAGGFAPGAWAQVGWKPERNVEFIIGATPGSQLDAIVRRAQAIWQEKHLVEVPVTPVNKAGGSQSIATAYLLNQRAGDGHYLEVFYPTLLSSYAIGNHNVDYSRATPLACLGSEYYVWAVRADSPIKSGKDLIGRLSSDPGSLSMGTSNIGGIGHIQMLSVLKGAGVDVGKLKMVGFKGGGEARTALLGGHIDINSTSGSNMLGDKQSGKIRVIAVNAPARLGGAYADIPTWKELGVAAPVISGWTCVIGAEGLSPAQIAYWDRAFGELVKTDEWRTDAERSLRSLEYKNSSETGPFLKAEFEALQSLIKGMGLVSRASTPPSK